MRRFGWSAVAGFGVAGLLFASPAVLAHEKAGAKGSTASGHMEEHGTSSGSGSSASGHMGEGKDTSAATSESEARGSGQAGESTGARPGEVTGSAKPAETDAEKAERRASAATDELEGTISEFNRAERTLSLKDSDKKLKLTDDTEVIKDGNKVPPGQIMEGDEVRASFSGSGDTLEVLKLEVTSGLPERETGTGAATESEPPEGGSPKGTAPGKSSETGSGSTGVKSPQ